MIKKSVTWKDLLGTTHTEDFYFHLKQDEVIRMEVVGRKGSTFSEYLQTMVKSDDKGEILTALEGFIRASYGKRSDDGRRFSKNKDWTDEFMSSEAYTVLFMELITSEVSLVEFIMGVFPAEMMESAEVQQALAKVEIPGTQLMTPADQERLFAALKPMPAVGPEIQDADIPAGFRRPPAAQAKSVIALPVHEGMTREDILAAYDKQFGRKPDDPDPAA